MTLPPQLFGHWVHSHEEDSGGAEVYRPRGWPLPPARGRKSFEIKPDGEFMHYGPGPTDVSTGLKGRWKAVAPDRIAISLPGKQSYELQILDAGQDLLRVAR